MEPSNPLVKGRKTRKYESDEEMRNELLRLAGPQEQRETLYYHRLATPLVQVFSVNVYTGFDDGKPCEIYGSIRAIDGRGTAFDLYDRERSECEMFWKHGTLSLIGPEGGPFLRSTGATIDLDLKDKTRDVGVIKGQHNLDSTTEEIEDSYDKLMRAVVQGERGFACLYYMTFQHAVFATVEVSIVKKSGGSCKFADVHGRVIAGYGNSRRYCSNDDEMKYLETTLLEMPPERPMRILVGTPIRLARSVIAVPAYSSLIINAFLSDSQCPFANGSVEFMAGGLSRCIKLIQVEDDCIQVKVAWKNAYLHLYTKKQLKGCSEVAGKKNHSKVEEEQKKARVLPYQHSSSLFLNGSVPSTSTVSKNRLVGFDLVEVFSVFIGGINHDISALCGTIKVYYGSRHFLIFERDQENPEFLLPDKSIASIESHTHITNCEFQIYLDLRDPVQDLEVSKGRVAWHIGNLEYSMSWFNKRLCSVVQGKHGYAAVHYIVFSSAYRANVEVTFFLSNLLDVAPNVYGYLFTSYSGHGYPTGYEKKYYRGRLFDKPQDKPVRLTTGSIIQLSKSVVAVPTNSSLIIEADLTVLFIGNQKDELCGSAEFEIDTSCTSCKELRGQCCRIEVSVQFMEW